jgi:hypothetical protein
LKVRLCLQSPHFFDDGDGDGDGDGGVDGKDFKDEGYGDDGDDISDGG